MSTGMLELLAEDVKTIPYRPQFRKITDSVTAAILLQQMFYRWFHNKKQPFYKYKEACTADDYREGDSWCEELGFSRAEFDTALVKIGQKVVKGTPKDYDALVWYWTAVDRKTWYEVNEVAFRKATIQLYEKQESSSPKSDNPAIDIHTKNTSENSAKIEADACEALPSPTPTENFLFPLQEKGLVTKPKTRRTPTPPIAPAPPSPSRNPAAAALSAKNRELLKEFEPKARPIWAAIEKQINALANGDNPMTPEEYEYVFRALKRDPWWANKPLTPSIVGKQAGAILPHVENQVTMELNYAW